jgi:Tfp pilus assembly protein PilF
VLTNRGILHMANGAPNTAILDFERALQLDPNHAPAQQQLQLARKNQP